MNKLGLFPTLSHWPTLTMSSAKLHKNYTHYVYLYLICKAYTLAGYFVLTTERHWIQLYPFLLVGDGDYIRHVS